MSGIRRRSRWLSLCGAAAVAALSVSSPGHAQGGPTITPNYKDADIRQIIEATIGPVCVVDCIDEPEACTRADYCECRVVYALINLRIGEVLEEFTLADGNTIVVSASGMPVWR